MRSATAAPSTSSASIAGRLGRVRRGLTSAFIGWNLLALFAAGFPGEGRWFHRLHALAEPYNRFFGLWQRWDMFSPEPMKVNLWLDAELTYPDGTVLRVHEPQPETLSAWQRVVHWRYRKWIHRVRLDTMTASWPDTARYFAIQHRRDGHGVPRHVALIRRFSTLPEEGDAFVRIGEEARLPEEDARFFEADIDAGALP